MVYVNRSTGDTWRQGRGMFHPLPVSPTPTGRFTVDTAPRERFPSAGFRRGTPRRILFSPVARYPNHRHALPAPLRGRAEARNAPGGGGVPAKTVQSEMHETGAGDVPPPPRQPLPHGAIPCRYSATGEIPFSWFQARTPRRSCFPPWHGIRTIAKHSPAPSEGGGRRRGTRREVGVFQRIPFNRRCMRQGRGMFHPPPRQPLPHGAIPHRYSATGEISFSWFQAWNSPKNPVFPRGTASELSPCTARPLGRGRAEARNAPGGGGVFQRLKTVPGDTSRDGGAISHRHTAREETTSLPSV